MKKSDESSEKLDQHSFTPAPSIHNFKQDSEKYILDNNALYKKLIDLEAEIKVLQDIVNKIIIPKPIQQSLAENVSSGDMNPNQI
jgi:hypothetical protein